MSFVVFVLIFAFIAWQRLGRSRRARKFVQPEAARPQPPTPQPSATQRSATQPWALSGDAGAEDIAADVAGLVSTFLGQNSRDLIEQAVSLAVNESRESRAGRRLAVAMEPIEKAIMAKKTAVPPREKRRAKYLLDGDGGYRQRTDRTARLQQQFGGKGLCSPR
ncbi:MAG: hypothetical protein J0I79_06810 [Mesorhizobium sp.]|uniref:hypothetical protein n=1 Tax=Mesorhizobium sp. TaxID=1871066 RepID=UPI001AD31A82|nr:hypothetical protein [Mesorhizobium sp.]MBN9217645.1 hypothetical protein [Mesorhizobium sp.]